MSVYDASFNFPAFGSMPSGTTPSFWNSVGNWIFGPSARVSGVKDFLENHSINSMYDVQNYITENQENDNSAKGVVRKSSGSNRVPLDYYAAPLATRYGMNATTAYQEALSNTAHQREVSDLQAAGLNPILSTRYGGSAGVSGAQVLSYGSGGYGGSGSGASEKGLNLSAKAIGTLLGAGAGIAIGIKTGNYGSVGTLTSVGSKIGSLFD